MMSMHYDDSFKEQCMFPYLLKNSSYRELTNCVSYMCNLPLDVTLSIRISLVQIQIKNKDIRTNKDDSMQQFQQYTMNFIHVTQTTTVSI